MIQRITKLGCQQKYKGENEVLIGIDRDEPLETVIKFKKELKVTYPLALEHVSYTKLPLPTQA